MKGYNPASESDRVENIINSLNSHEKKELIKRLFRKDVDRITQNLCGEAITSLTIKAENNINTQLYKAIVYSAWKAMGCCGNAKLKRFFYEFDEAHRGLCERYEMKTDEEQEWIVDKALKENGIPIDEWIAEREGNGEAHTMLHAHLTDENVKAVQNEV